MDLFQLLRDLAPLVALNSHDPRLAPKTTKRESGLVVVTLADGTQALTVPEDVHPKR